MLKIYSELPELEKTDEIFLSKKFCNYKGIFNKKNGICYCFIGLFGNHCNILGIEIWGKLFWFIFQFIFATLFLIFSSLMIYKLIITLINYSSFLTKIFSLLLTPKNLVNLNLMVMSVSRFIYMCYDPYCQHKRANYQFDRIMNDLSISSISSIYLLLFIVFIGLNANLQRGTKMISKRCYVCAYKTLKFIVIVILFFIYPIQIYMSYCSSKIEIRTPYLTYLYIIFLGLFNLLYCITFYILFYLKKQLFKFYEMKKNINQQEIKVDVLENENFNSNNNSINNSTINYEDESQAHFLNSNEFVDIKKKNILEKKNKKQMIEFLTNVIKAKNIDSISYILGKKDAEIKYENEFEKNDDEVYFENEMKILDQFSTENDYLLQNYSIKYTLIKEQTNGQKKQSLVKKKKKKKKLKIVNVNENTFEDSKKLNDDFIMNESDRELVNNIFHYSFMYMLVTLFYFLYLFFSRIKIFLRFNWAMILLYFIAHLFDCIYMIVIYFLFFKNTSSQEYENLKYIGELENLNKGKFINGKVKIVYDDLANSCIGERFKGFINFEH